VSAFSVAERGTTERADTDAVMLGVTFDFR
jgi:hypothetical protein